jgi:hypothetical protein
MRISICHSLLSDWYQYHIEMDGKQPGDLIALRKALSSRGVNSRGWRLYVDNGDALFLPLREIYQDDAVCTNKGVFAATWLKILQACEMDVLPPVWLVASIFRWGIPEQKIENLPPLFLRAAWKACNAAEYAGESVVELVDTVIVPVARWYFSTGQHIEPNVNLLKAGWTSLENRFREVTIVRPTQSLPPAPEWPIPLRRHCIGSYGNRCRRSSLRAFSVRLRKTGNRIATLTVIFSDGVWKLDAISGLENSDVDDRIIQATDGLLRSMDEATAADETFRAFLAALKLPRTNDDIVESDDECCFPF